MILNRKGLPYTNEKRVKRLEWLLKKKDKYFLMNYPWGLDRMSKEFSDRYNVILKAMLKDELFSPLTQPCDINLNNLIIEVQEIVRRKRFIPD